MILLTKAQQLEQAEAAYHRLVTGTAAAEITDQNGEKIVYSKADQGKLLRYIASLKAMPRTTGPMRVYF